MNRGLGLKQAGLGKLCGLCFATTLLANNFKTKKFFDGFCKKTFFVLA